MADKKSKQRGLGRGLSALMADVAEDSAQSDEAPKAPERDIPIENFTESGSASPKF